MGSLPTCFEFADDEGYVESLLQLITSSNIFQTLCGGIHILDFLTKEPDLYHTVLPEEWRNWFEPHEVSDILDLLMKETPLELNHMGRQEQLPQANLTWRGGPVPPPSLLDYILNIRKHTLNRNFSGHTSIRGSADTRDRADLPKHVSVGMNPKKIHEVQNFTHYIENLSAYVHETSSYQITHVVDFGSGQNYLGRALASPPYSKHVVALECMKHNIDGARTMDVTAKLADKKKIMRNKKQYRSGLPIVNDQMPVETLSTEADQAARFFRSSSPQGQVSNASQSFTGGDCNIQYIEGYINDGDLSIVIKEIQDSVYTCKGIHLIDPHLMVVSLHSCGNLLHHGLRSLVLNPAVKVVAMVGCCYNLVTERLGPPTYKLPSLRSSHPRLDQTSSACDPHGFPMSERLSSYKHQNGRGICPNITARMMAVQAPENWTAQECESFFTRHFYRALLQRILCDYHLVQKSTDDETKGTSPRGWTGIGPPLIIGSLRKACYVSFTAYVRGAIAKLVDDPLRGNEIANSLKHLTDGEIELYEKRYGAKKKELSIIWSLMAFSASVVESTIVVDRWRYLKEQAQVKECWVEAVFDYNQSPRNLAILGIKQ